MEKLFAPYDIALKLKGKGFDESCFGSFDKISKKLKILQNSRFHSIKNNQCGGWYSDNACSAPLYQQVVDWFEEEHKIDIVPQKTYDRGGDWHCYMLIKNGKSVKFSEGDFDKRVALNKGIKEALKLIKKK